MSELLDGAGVHRIALPTPFLVGPVNVYLIEGDPLVLVDTGPRTDEAYDALTRGLARLGYRTSDIGVVLITHGHLDHMGLLRTIIEDSGAAVYAHPKAYKRFTNYAEGVEWEGVYFVALLRECGAPEESIAAAEEERRSYIPYGDELDAGSLLEDGQTVSDYRAVFVPGHSASDVVFVNETQRAAFTGDHLLKSIKPNPTLRCPEPGRPRPRTLPEYVASLKRTRGLDFQLSLPGHGEPFTNHRERIGSILERIDTRTGQVFAMLEAGPKTPFDICATLFPKLEARYLYLGMAAALGHLDILEDEGRIRAVKAGKVMVYEVHQRD